MVLSIRKAVCSGVLVWLGLASGCGGGGGSNSESADSSGTSACAAYAGTAVNFTVNDTGQTGCFDADGKVISCPAAGADFRGQDAQYDTSTPRFATCDDSVVVDQNTGLRWQKAHNERVSYADAYSACAGLTLGGYSDWRLPTIKELISIVNFSGTQDDASSTSPSNPYAFSDYFDIAYSTDTELGSLTGTHSRQMMGQTWSATTRPDVPEMNYFYNFLDGHLKSQYTNNAAVTLDYRCVRGEENKFENTLTDNGNGTVTDSATGLMWQQSNGYDSMASSYQFSWKNALAYCEDLSLGSHDDWRLPDVKELQSIVDYSNETDAINTAVFTQTIVPGTGPFFWSSTTYEEAPGFANYVCFGHCWNYTMTADIHGPGAQRSEPKYDNGHLPTSLGDQEDLVQAYDYVRCVR